MGLVSITSVQVDNELTKAKVYLSSLDEEEQLVQKVSRHKGKFRKAIGDQARIRRVPELEFILDPSISAITRIDDILANLHATETPNDHDTMVIGTETSTLDAEGEVLRKTHKKPSLKELQAASKDFVGAIKQIPPMVSAVKVQGKRLYEIAREGKVITREPRTVEIHELSISDGPRNNVFTLKVKCGSGTYIRSLVSDIAQQAGSLGHVGTLRRTAIGSHNEIDASRIEKAVIIELTEGLRDYEMIQVNDTMKERIKVGAVVRIEELSPVKSQGPWVIVDSEQNLLAMYENFKTGTLKPAVVLPQEN